MRQRTNKAFYFFAFCLLLFAGYLNFIRKDKDMQQQPYQKLTVQSSTKGTVLVSNPEQYVKEHIKKEVIQTP